MNKAPVSLNWRRLPRVTSTPVWRLKYDPLNFVGRCCSPIGKHQSTKRGSLRGPVVCCERVGRWRSALGLQASLDRRMPAGDCSQSGLLQSEPSLCSHPPELRNSRQASPMGSKTSAKSEKAIAVKKESPRHRNANAPTKVVASPVTAKTSRQHGKSDAKSKDTAATKIETPQPAQSDGQPRTLKSKNSVATKVETPQPAQSYGQSDANRRICCDEDRDPATRSVRWPAQH